YDYRPNKGEVVHVDNKDPLEYLHMKAFVDSVLHGVKPTAPISAGVEATVPVEMALASYWDNKTISRNELT
ncbi:MAG: hypothetical protein ABI142_07825, partial [Bryocella sp.]